MVIEVDSKVNKPLHDVNNVLSFIPKELNYNDVGALVVTGYFHNDNK